MDGEKVPGSFRVDSKLLGVIAVTVLFLVSLYTWTLPFQKNKLPFGEGDSAWHFAIGDHISSSDEASFRLPYYVGLWYYGFNSILGPFAPEYPPPNHINYALMQVFGGERFIPVLIYRAIASFLGVFAVYFVISKLFGVLPGFIAGLGLSFSIREQLTFLFGQQPTLTSLVITPVATYAWYMYLTMFYGEQGSQKAGKTYLFITIALLSSQFLLHLQGFVDSAVLMAIFTGIMAIRYRKLPVSKANFKSLAIAAILLAAVIASFAAIYLGVPDTTQLSFSISSRLFQWGISPDLVQGSFPPAFVDFSAEYAKNIVPFLVAGLVLLAARLFLLKNKTRELFLLSWLIGTYIVLHLDMLIGMGANRVARMLVLENYLFFSLIALSVVWLPQMASSLLKIDRRIASAAKYALAIVLIIIIFSAGFGATKDRLQGAYSGIERITPLQAEFAANYLNKLPEKAFIYDPVLPNVGGFSYTTWRYPKMRWMLAISQRYVGRDTPEQNRGLADKDQAYVLFDYSDIALLASASDPGTSQLGQALANELKDVETEMFNNTEPMYNNNNMLLYKYAWKNGTNSTVAAT